MHGVISIAMPSSSTTFKRNRQAICKNTLRLWHLTVGIVAARWTSIIPRLTTVTSAVVSFFFRSWSSCDLEGTASPGRWSTERQSFDLVAVSKVPTATPHTPPRCRHVGPLSSSTPPPPVFRVHHDSVGGGSFNCSACNAAVSPTFFFSEKWTLCKGSQWEKLLLMFYHACSWGWCEGLTLSLEETEKGVGGGDLKKKRRIKNPERLFPLFFGCGLPSSVSSHFSNLSLK